MGPAKNKEKNKRKILGNIIMQSDLNTHTVVV
jgi:hypothetical protein